MNTDSSLIYLASPYMDDCELIRKRRYLEATEVTAALIGRGRHVFSPIVFCHPIALEYDRPKDSDYWISYNESMLKRCDDLYVLCINGVDTSVGVNREIIIAEEASIPMLFIERLAATTFSNVKGDLPFISPRRARVTWGVKI